VVRDRIQRSGARCDAVGPIGGSSPLAKGPHRPYMGSTVVHRWIGTCSVTEELEADAGVARMMCMCVSGGWSVRRRTSSLVSSALVSSKATLLRLCY